MGIYSMEKKLERKRIRELIRGNRGMMFGIAICLAVSAIIIYSGVWSYRQYRQELIETEQEQLLTMAETVGTSLVNFVEQEIEKLDLYFSALELQVQTAGIDRIEQAAEQFYDSGRGLYDAVACYDSMGRLIFQKGSMDYGFRGVADTKEAAICGKRLTGDHYEMFLSRKFLWGEELYTVLYAMNLDRIYERIVEPVKIGKGGYSVVKDRDLSIIMHHAPGQIGMDAVYDRSIRYPQLDLTDLTRWIELQQKQPEGVAVINSYMWDDPELSPEKRIVAYTSISLPGEHWIVNSTLPFKELNGPLNRMLLRLMGISGMFFGVAVVFVAIMTRTLVRSEGQKREIAYLRQINDGMELLCRKEEEIQHYQRVQTIGQMSSHIAHEFNNYLTPVMLYGEILESDDSVSDENRELVKGILNAAGQAAELSRKLLDFSRQDSGAVLTVVNLTEEVHAAVHMVRQLTPEKIAFSAELSDEPIYVRGKAGMAEHILMNLCNNAYHAMEDCGGTLMVQLCHVETGPDTSPEQMQEQTLERARGVASEALSSSDKGWAVLSVSDTGCGISRDVLDKIFEPFYTTKRSGKGTGLGLSVIHNLMMAVGGQIQVDSEQGKGSTFRLYFPETEKMRKPDSSRGSRRVMVVDDDSLVIESLEAAFRQRKWKVECYNHPAAALARLQKHSEGFDMVLTDYTMPSMNGLEFAAVVRRMYPEIRLILMSGGYEEAFDWYLKNQFIDGFILKSDLAKRLDSLL